MIDNKFELSQLQETKSSFTDPKFEDKKCAKESDGMDMDEYEDVSDHACYYKSLMDREDSSVYTLPYHHTRHT